MENVRISASEASGISSTVIPEADNEIDKICLEIRRRAGIGQNSLTWPAHKSIHRQIEDELKKLGYSVKSKGSSEKDKYIIPLQW